MGSKWLNTTIGDEFDLKTGGTPNKSESENFINGTIPWLLSGDINRIQIHNCKNFITKKGLNSSNARLLPKDIVMIALNGQGKTKGTVAMLRIEATCNQSLVGIIPKNRGKQLPEFLFYFLQSQYQKIRKLAGGDDRRGLNMGLISSIQFSYPENITTQKNIVAKLDTLFEKIDKAIALLEENKNYSQALMGSVLDGFFDKVAEKYPATPLLKHVEFVGGSQPPKSSFSDIPKDGYVRLIQIRDYKSDNHIVYIKESSTKKFCDLDDVMIGRYGPPVFQILRGLKGAYNVALMKAVPDETVISKDFLFYFLMNGKIQNYIISISQRSAGQSGVNKKALEAYEIAIPPPYEQKRIVDNIKSAISKIEKTQKLIDQNLNHLKFLKSSLLDQAFKGEL